MRQVLANESMPSYGFVRVQCLVFAFYYILFHAWAVYQMLIATRSVGAPPSAALTAWAVVVAGGYAQAQATFIGSATYEWTSFAPLEQLALPQAGWALAVALAALPAAFAVRCVLAVHR